jgi:F0F1-type ATP synthase assembly protein I
MEVREFMPENDEPEEEVTRKSGMAYAAALTLFFSVLVFLGVGWLLDSWLGTSPWMLVGGLVLGAVVGFYEFIVILSKATK